MFSMITTLSFFLEYCFVIMVAVSANAQEKPVILEYGKSTKVTDRYSITVWGTSSVDYGGQQVVTHGSMTGEIAHKIAAVESSKFTHELTYTKLKLATSSEAAGELIVNSEGMVNKVLKITANKYGREQNILNLNELQIPDINVFGALISFLDVVPELSTSPVKLNDEWKTQNTYSYDAPTGKVRIEGSNTMKYVGMEKKMDFTCAKIEVQSSFTLSGYSKTPGQMGTYMGVGSEKALIYFAYDAGKVVEINKISQTDLQVTIPEINQEIPVSQSVTMMITLIK